MKEQPRFRVATYNTHKCRGIDGRIRPSRVAEVLNELGADVIALQEVVSLKGARKEQDQAQYLADAAGYDYRIGETRKLRGAVYGNVILSRFPVREVLLSPQLKHPRLIIGDFNEWTRGLVSKSLQHSFESVDIQLHLNRKRTYPGVLPIMHLDHMYFDRDLALEEFLLHRSRMALLASDHLPLVAEFCLGGR